MASIRVGGDPESYMDPPVLTADGKKGGAGLIASVLDLLGIHKQVAKEPKPAEGASPAPAPTQNPHSVPVTPVQLPVLGAAESAFPPSQGLDGDWGKRYLESLRPLQRIDPDQGMTF